MLPADDLAPCRDLSCFVRSAVVAPAAPGSPLPAITTGLATIRLVAQRPLRVASLNCAGVGHATRYTTVSRGDCVGIQRSCRWSAGFSEGVAGGGRPLLLKVDVFALWIGATLHQCYLRTVFCQGESRLFSHEGKSRATIFIQAHLRPSRRLLFFNLASFLLPSR